VSKPHPTKSELEHIRKIRVIDGVVSVANNLVRFGCLALAFYFSYRMVDSLAGKETFADVGIRMLFDSRVLAIIFGSGGLVYGLAERKLRQRTVKKLHPRIKVYEQLLDPARTSSSLTETGETNPEDE
jgi:TRAP-type C4-dicarboxylate transport system permease small subunit